MATPVNPFLALSQGISKTESIAFAAVFGVFFLALTFRVVRRPKHAMIYRFLVFFAAIRVATFAVRHEVAAAHPSDKNFMALLIASGVLVVAGFLLLAEAVLTLMFDWSITMRGRDIGRLTLWIGFLRHGLLTGISLIGIVGAVLQITSVDKRDMQQYETAKHLRQASGAMFMGLSAWAIILPLFLLAAYCPARVKKLVPTTVCVLCGVALLMESVYRVLSASWSKGFIVTTVALDVLLVLPELLVLFLLTALDFDDLAAVNLFSCRKKVTAKTAELELEPQLV